MVSCALYIAILCASCLLHNEFHFVLSFSLVCSLSCVFKRDKANIVNIESLLFKLKRKGAIKQMKINDFLKKIIMQSGPDSGSNNFICVCLLI
jgi:hypothetical protein